MDIYFGRDQLVFLIVLAQLLWQISPCFFNIEAILTTKGTFLRPDLLSDISGSGSDNFAITHPILQFLFSSETLDNGLFAELKTFDHCLQEVWKQSNLQVSPAEKFSTGEHRCLRTKN